MTTQAAPADSAPAPPLNGVADPGPLRAARTANFPALLRQLGVSLLVTTYQSGKLVPVRLNAHFCAFQAPMSVALDGDRLVVGTTLQV